ncbi:MAG: shikimate kinase AroK [Pseudomonadales bacterium]|jgi:shikimate kinase|nr:shikimate kinase AroK [Pseudomonadales bacterium]MDP6471802.1 shikimate kinase AroK [Pseudomonadales bacterium]MDP6828784.1 shikimate kinase AroK [Pseudomonadales bacterium]MDP6970283.1 shikimate kinase AroK [Pseudomonadales bacterium]|tara:strand:+ start:44 stop:571 length:528 start_codon:yes stop_codon:yes gene_type:complete
MARSNIFFVGLMAVGKSTVGRLLAQSLEMEFYDSDHYLEERAGAPVAWIFDVEGEKGFRDREENVIDEISKKDGIVLATGGGAIVREANRTHLAARGCVIHLDSPVERLVERTLHDKKRPLLQQGNVQQTLVRLHAERAGLYASVADYTFITDRQGPKVLTREIEKKLREDGVVR